MIYQIEKSMELPPILFKLGKIRKTFLFRKSGLLRKRVWIRESFMHKERQKL